ncbi:hypothetical protein HDU79_006904, partial [Rhizoclosmatium sp. JEL0117]
SSWTGTPAAGAKYPPILRGPAPAREEPLLKLDSPMPQSDRVPGATPTSKARYSHGHEHGHVSMRRLSASDLNGNVGSSKQAPTTTMLDLHSIFSTPNSAPKYSERDVALIRNELTIKFEKDFELAQLELQELDTKRKEAVKAREEMEGTLKEWEEFMKTLIAKKEQDEAIAAHATSTLRATLTALEKQNADLQKEHADLQSRHRQLRLDLQDEQDRIAQAQKSKQDAEAEIKTWQDKYEALKQHAEEKLESANVEIAKVRTHHSAELAALKVKLTRVELHAQALERSVESKERENAELTRICDDLLVQIEGRG